MLTPLTPRRKLGTASKIVGGLGALLAATWFLLQSLRVLPAGDSPGNTLFKILLFVVSGAFLLLYALAEKDFSQPKAEGVDIWLRRLVWIFFCIVVVALIAIAVRWSMGEKAS